MTSPASIDLKGGFSIDAPVDTAFELFSPLGEKRWVPSWNPELLHPPGETWARGLIFRTKEQRGEAVWFVTDLNRERHEVEYSRVDPTRYVARVRVQCKARGAGKTDVTVTYTFVGLTPGGNREIKSMTESAYEDKMKRWQGWIAACLAKS
jgi:Polyketide cyclase / dehydrase and lipid transport